MEAVEVIYTIGDWYAATFQSWRTYVKRVCIFTGILSVVFVALPVVLDGETFSDVLYYFPWEILAGAAAFLLLFELGIYPLISFLWIRRHGGLGAHRFVLGEDGLRVENTKGEALIYWSTMKRVIASRDRLFMFVGPALAYVLPMRVFPDKVGFDAAVEEAKSRWTAANP